MDASKDAASEAAGTRRTAPAAEWKPSFVRLVAAALRERGLDVERSAPGGSPSVDLFVSNLPRAGVVVSTAATPAAVASRTTAVGSGLRSTFSNELRLFVVVDRRVAARWDAGGGVGAEAVPLAIDPDAGLEAEASRVADEIVGELDRVRREHWGLPRLARLRIGPGAAEIAAAPREPQRDARERRACAAATRALLTAFRDLAPGRADILEHEVLALEAEFARGHFTACALRVGRCLECIVYSVAGEWNVPVDEIVLESCSRLRDGVEEVARRLVEYRDLTTEAKKDNAKRQLRELGARLNEGLLEALMRLDEPHDSVPVRADTPKNIEAILRDIRRAYARHDPIRRALDALLDDGRVRRILDVRNDAAHAAPDGRREVDRRTVLAVLEDVNEVLRALSRIGEDVLALATRPREPSAG